MNHKYINIILILTSCNNTGVAFKGTESHPPLVISAKKKTCLVDSVCLNHKLKMKVSEQKSRSVFQDVNDLVVAFDTLNKRYFY